MLTNDQCYARHQAGRIPPHALVRAQVHPNRTGLALRNPGRRLPNAGQYRGGITTEVAKWRGRDHLGSGTGKSLSDLPVGDIVGGEVRMLDDIGRSDFERLHWRAPRKGWCRGDDAVA